MTTRQGLIDSGLFKETGSTAILADVKSAMEWGKILVQVRITFDAFGEPLGIYCSVLFDEFGDVE